MLFCSFPALLVTFQCCEASEHTEYFLGRTGSVDCRVTDDMSGIPHCKAIVLEDSVDLEDMVVGSAVQTVESGWTG